MRADGNNRQPSNFRVRDEIIFVNFLGKYHNRL